MIANFTPHKEFTKAEKFFTEKLLELFYNRTIDSHRAKLNNPRWILIELHQVLMDWQQGKIKAFDRTIVPVLRETLRFIEDRHFLTFGSVDLKFYKDLLGKASDKQYQQVAFATKLLNDLNSNYRTVLFGEVEKEISRLNSVSNGVEGFETLSKLLDFLSTEVINQGYAKGYLFSITSRIFNDERALPFADAFAEMKDAIDREEEEFTVVFKLNKLGGGNKKIDIKSDFEIGEERIGELAKINKKSAAFFSNQNAFCYFLEIRAKAHDYLSVIEKAKKHLFTLIDLIHLGYPDNPFDFTKKCLVVGTRKPELTNTQPVVYIPDGSYKNNEELYDLLLEKIKRLKGNRALQRETVQKIVSAFRHLRLGRDADELEQKFLNYWIGLEYIFSNYDVHDTTITRLKEYFIHSHSVAYFKRNLNEFHSDIKRLKLQDAIPGLNDDLEYLKNAATYDYIIGNFSDAYPLLAFRAHKYKQLITGTKKLSEEILKHRTNLEWHLTRCYRIRNEIVHDAAIHLNIESITGNLKYYLTYILNGLLTYLDTVHSDDTVEGSVSISDFFMLQEIKYKSIDSAGFPLAALMAEKSATEIFSK